MEIALLDTVSKTLEGSRLVGVSAVNKNSWMLPFEREAKVNIGTEAVGNVDQTELIEFIVNLWKGVLKHVLLTLKDS